MFGPETHTEPVVHGLAVGHGDADVATPAGERLGIAALQINDHLPRPVGERRITLEPRRCLGVEPLEVAERLAVLAGVVQMRHQAPETGAPVTDVILADHVVAQGFQHACHGVADDGAAQVMDLHLLGEVGMGIVDDDTRAATHGVDGVAKRRGKEAVVQAQADEAGPGYLRTRCDAGEVAVVEDPRRQVARLDTRPLGGRHGAVRLVVAEFRPCRRTDDGIGVRDTGTDEPRFEAVGE